MIAADNSVKVIRSIHLQDDLSTFLAQEKWLNKKYNKVRTSVYDDSRTLVPSEFFDFNELETFYGAMPNMEVKLLYDYIDKLNYYNIYKIPTAYFNLIREKYPQSLFQCGTSIWINSLIEENHYNVATKMYISAGEKYLEIAILDSQELAFSGSFLCKTPEDFLYYILTSAKEQNLDLTSDQFFLLDNFNEDSIFSLLQKYIPNIKTGYPPEKHDIPDDLKLEKLFHHYDLLVI